MPAERCLRTGVTPVEPLQAVPTIMKPPLPLKGNHQTSSLGKELAAVNPSYSRPRTGKQNLQNSPPIKGVRSKYRVGRVL